MLANKETDKSLASMIKREIRDEKAVKTAIKRLYNGEFVITEGGEEKEETADDLAQTIEAVEAAAEAAVSVFDGELCNGSAIVAKRYACHNGGTIQSQN